MKILLFTFVILTCTACIAQDFPSISAEEAMQKKAQKDGVVFVDVRTVNEYDGPLGHIDGAILIPLHTLDKNFEKLDDYKDRQLIVYCRSGNRSQSGTRFLREKGFNAYNMLGGIKAWNKLSKKE